MLFLNLFDKIDRIVEFHQSTLNLHFLKYRFKNTDVCKISLTLRLQFLDILCEIYYLTVIFIPTLPDILLHNILSLSSLSKRGKTFSTLWRFLRRYHIIFLSELTDIALYFI